MNPLAVLAGADVGTVGALGSLNTVVAALLGRLVLQEPLGKVHLLAVGLSVLGAVFISDPVEAVASMGSSLLGSSTRTTWDLHLRPQVGWCFLDDAEHFCYDPAVDRWQISELNRFAGQQRAAVPGAHRHHLGGESFDHGGFQEVSSRLKLHADDRLPNDHRVFVGLRCISFGAQDNLDVFSRFSML
eukprot:g20810.t1